MHFQDFMVPTNLVGDREMLPDPSESNDEKII